MTFHDLRWQTLIKWLVFSLTEYDAVFFADQASASPLQPPSTFSSLTAPSRPPTLSHTPSSAAFFADQDVDPMPLETDAALVRDCF